MCAYKDLYMAVIFKKYINKALGKFEKTKIKTEVNIYPFDSVKAKIILEDYLNEINSFFL